MYLSPLPQNCRHFFCPKSDPKICIRNQLKPPPVLPFDRFLYCCECYKDEQLKWLFSSSNMEPRRLLHASLTLLILVTGSYGGEKWVLLDSLVVDDLWRRFDAGFYQSWACCDDQCLCIVIMMTINSLLLYSCCSTSLQGPLWNWTRLG